MVQPARLSTVQAEALRAGWQGGPPWEETCPSPRTAQAHRHSLHLQKVVSSDLEVWLLKICSMPQLWIGFFEPPRGPCQC